MKHVRRLYEGFLGIALVVAIIALLMGIIAILGQINPFAAGLTIVLGGAYYFGYKLEEK